MSTDVDIRELAIDRDGNAEPSVHTRRHLLTRYALPAALILGFLSLVAWSSRDLVFPPKPVTVVPVLSTTAEFRQAGTPVFNAAGWIEPRPTPIRVAALAPGVVERLLVVENQPVTVGEPVAELVKDDAQLAHEKALADLRLREAELAEAKSVLKAAATKLTQPVHLEAELGDAEASLARVEASLANLPFQLRRAEAELKTAQTSYDGKVSAREAVAGIKITVAKGELESAEAMVQELRVRFDSLKREQAGLSQRRDAIKTKLQLLADETKEKETANARVEAAVARVEQATVAVAEAKLRVDRMIVRSPVDGRVYRLIAHPGARIGGELQQMVDYDGSTIVTLYRPSMLQVRVDVRFEDIPKVSLDQPVEIDNPALTSPMSGKVLFFSSEADIQKNTIQVKVEIPDPPSVFKPEMLVDVTFLAPKQAEQAVEPSTQLRLYVLKQLIHEDDAGSFVWLADQSEGIARKAFVQTGPVGFNGLVEITAGLNVSNRIIAGGSEGLRDGQRVTIGSEDPSFGTANSIQAGTGGSSTAESLPTGGKQ